METHRATLPQKKQTDRHCGANVRFSMVSSTSLKTAAIGVTYPEICLLTQRCFGNKVARNWVLDEIMDKLHGKVREQAQKNRSGQPW